MCAANFRILDHKCVACPEGQNEAGDDTAGADTYCDVPTCHGTAAGAKCQFPFTSHGKTFTACTAAAPPPSGALLAVGTKVEAKRQVGSKWQKAEITNAHTDDTYDLKYDDGGTESKVKREWIRYRPDRAFSTKEEWCMTASAGKWGKCECGPCGCGGCRWSCAPLREPPLGLLAAAQGG